jgi:hypothetical protein
MLYVALALALTSPLPLAGAAAVPAAGAPAVAADGTVVPNAPVPLVPDAAATELAGRFTPVIKCDAGKKDPGRHLCALTRVGKDPIWTPGAASTYLGVSIKIKPGADPKTDLKKIGTEPVTLAALHLAAASARVEQLGAASADDKPRQTLLTDLQNQLKGDKKDALVVAPELVGRLRDERKKTRNPLKLDKAFAEFTGPAPTRLYRADLAPVLGVTTGPVPAFVTVETVADGQQLSIFPATAIEK